jgi:DNA-binding NtrC family response regulator
MSPLHTILVVDDDRDLREVLQLVLEDATYIVLTAADGYEAVRHLAERHIDLMITDPRMPGLSGFELGQQAKLLRPQLRVIYFSGYHSESQGNGPTNGVLLEKPIRLAELLNAVKRELGV